MSAEHDPEENSLGLPDFDLYEDVSLGDIHVPNVRVFVLRNGGSSAKLVPEWEYLLLKKKWSLCEKVCKSRVYKEPLPARMISNKKDGRAIDQVPGKPGMFFKRDSFSGMRTTPIISLAQIRAKLEHNYGSVRLEGAGGSHTEHPIFEVVFPGDSFEEFAAKAYPDLFGDDEDTKEDNDQRERTQAEVDAEAQLLANEENDDEESEDTETNNDTVDLLQTIPGIAHARALSLISMYGVGSIEDVGKLTVKQLSAIKGISAKGAKKVLDFIKSLDEVDS